MKQICKLTMMMLAVFLWTGCTEEKEQGGGTGPEPGGETPQQRREVLLTLNNELILKKAGTKAGDNPIATAEENAISSLDVYVFGCATEEGDYTFQEQFSYRTDDTAELPSGATELDLTATDETNKQTKGLIKLKKGLFVKFYCIANCPTLIDPATNTPVPQASFVPLTFTDPEQAGTGVATEGKPMESEFISYHTPLLQADKADDILLTPLAMSSSYTIPLDLTDLETSTRVQIGFKLTRLAARFDIINKADESRFTIKEVAMGNGRRGSTIFPIRVYGDLPTAKDGERIVYPARAFDGAQANKGTQTGAFYSYPSPLEDQGYLILKGTYQANQTDEQEVSYRIPFTQPNNEGGSTALEINNNHRYTIAITKADDYHLDFTLTVADWTDSGHIDDYEPGKDGAGTISVEIPDTYKDKSSYLEDTRTVSMYIKDNASNFDIIVRSSAPVSLQPSYAGGPAAKEYDWLTVSKLEQTLSADLSVTEYRCHLSLVAGYDKKRYPKAILRFMNLTDGSENVIFVDALAAPSLDVTTQPEDSHNAFDPLTATATLYRVTNSTVKIKLTCPDGVSVKDKPDWLELTDTQTSDTETTFTFKLTDRDVIAADNKGIITFCNANQIEWIVEVTVLLTDASSNTEFTNVGGSTDNTLTGSIASGNAEIKMGLVKSNSFTVNTNSLDGISVEIAYEGGASSPKWLSFKGNSALKSSVKNNISFTLNENELATGLATKATVTLKNISGGPDASFTVIPQFTAPTTAAVESSATPKENSFNSSTNTISLYKVSNSSVRIKASSLGGNIIKDATGVTVTKTSDTYARDNEYTVAWDNSAENSGSFKVVNKSDESKETLVQVTLLDATITPTFSDVSGGNSCVDKTVTMKLLNGSSFKLKTASVSGVNPVITYPSGGPQWLTCAGGTTKSASTSNNLVFNFDKTKITSEAQTATVTLKNLIAGGEDFVYTVEPEYQSPTSTSSTNMSMQVNNSVNTLPTITITGNCIGGSTIEGPAWLTFNTTSSDTEAFSYTVSINPNSSDLPTSSPGNQTITIKNKTKADKTTPITVNITETTARTGSFSGYHTSESGNYTYRYTTDGGTITITAYGLFTAPTIGRNYDSNYCNSTNYGNSWIQSESVSTKIVNNRREYTFTIPVRASSGSDAAYQLHKGSVTVKHNGSTIRTYTVWKGASTYEYWVGTSYSGSPYYSALKKGGYWWAPVNCGAKRIPTSGSDTYGQGNLYQWGRRDETNSGSSTSSYGPTSSTTPDNHVFYLSENGPWDWLTPQNSYLWNGTSKGSNDPCPTGWRVPTINELETLGSGYTSNLLFRIYCDSYFPQLIFPVFGYRARYSGTMIDTNRAYSYTSNANGVKTYDYQVDTQTREDTARANAYPIRCIKQ